MDHSYPYIASLTREPFLFYEMRSTAKLMAERNSDDAIVTKGGIRCKKNFIFKQRECH